MYAYVHSSSYGTEQVEVSLVIFSRQDFFLARLAYSLTQFSGYTRQACHFNNGIALESSCFDCEGIEVAFRK